MLVSQIWMTQWTVGMIKILKTQNQKWKESFLSYRLLAYIPKQRKRGLNNFAKAFATKDPYQSEHISKIVYKFACASCNAIYAGHSCRHVTTRTDEHFGKDKKSHIYKHFTSST